MVAALGKLLSTGGVKQGIGLALSRVCQCCACIRSSFRQSILCSRTIPRQPHTWERRRWQWAALDFVSNSNGVRPDWWLGTLLYKQTACFTARDHKAMSLNPLSVQCREECTIKVQAMYVIVRISHSAQAFWCCAPTPEKEWDCPLCMHSWQYSSAEKIPLS